MRTDSILFAILLLGLAGCKPGGAAPASVRPPQRVEVVTLARKNLSQTLEVAGSLEANESVSIHPELAGLVRDIAFQEGQAVEKGALLARLEDAELRAELAAAEARAELALLNRERSDALAADRSLAQAEVDRVRSQDLAAQAALELLRVRLARTRIVAPISGTLGARLLSPGNYVTPVTVLTTLEDLSVLKVSFRVPERSVPEVRPGTHVIARVRVGADVRPLEVEGDVFFVSSGIDPSVRATEVKAVLRDPPPALRPGMFASVRILLSTRENVLVAPETALLAGADGVQVIAVGEAAGRPVARYVKVHTGFRLGTQVELSAIAPDTLEAGDRVLSSGVGAIVLFPGAPLDPVPAYVEVRPLDEERP
jgi:membrane fusion protein (multidrug efflux system)